MTPQTVITIGLILTVGASALLIAAILLSRRAEAREKRLACLRDPMVCREVFRK